TTALANGAAYIDAVATPQAALDAAAKVPGGRAAAILGGERGGLRIDGFDLGNSPAEYTPQRMQGTPVIFTTTNGTAAALHAAASARMCFGCFANLSAVASWARLTPAPIHILCAGTNGYTSLDDALFAGALADRLLHDLQPSPIAAADPDKIDLYIGAWRNARTQGLAGALAQTRGGRGLAGLGFGSDIELAARIDTCTVVGQMNPATGRINAWKPGS
ncbi:MAG: 2-phosphosulfolactate phosphatase, partial [Planctomycetota bacterium]|nr:2-phosphosulfolactate phosphatase [Planctomycetota bacterium]